MRTPTSSNRSFFKPLALISSQIRNRLLLILALVASIVFLVYFDIQQGFTSWETINSKLSIFVAINANIMLLIVIFYMLLKNLLRLIFERNQQVLGVSLKTKLIIAFILISLPATLSHLFSTLFTYSTLESWLNVQKEAAIQNAQSVSQAYDRNLKHLMETQGWAMEEIFRKNPEILNNPDLFLKHIADVDIEGAAIYSESREVLTHVLRTHKSNKYWKPISETIWEVMREQQQMPFLENLGKRYLYRHLRRVEFRDNIYILENIFVYTKHLSSALNDLDEHEINTKILSESEGLIKNYFITSLILMVLLILFVATWFAIYLARGFVKPIEQLADATQRVAHGELGYQISTEKGTPLDKDFWSLVSSFNEMSHQLFENQRALEKTTTHLQKSHQDLEEHNRFVELILENIKTGVMSLNMKGEVTGLNRSAKKLLQLKSINQQGEHYENILEKESLDVFKDMFLEIESSEKTVINREVIFNKSSESLHISAALLTLKNRDNLPVGMISVYENVTEIQRFQRAQAWRDVARRIAHEIKNPLTPIQLSAQRIRRKYLHQLEDGEVLEQATQTIVNEVELLKKMVKEFSQFARIPESNLQLDDLNLTIQEALQLYRNAMPEEIQLQVDLDSSLPLFSLDREQLKRVFINLVDNAVAAMDGNGEITISTHFHKDLKMVRTEVQDNGPGVPQEIRHNLFEPYVTTQAHGTGLGLSIVSQIVSDHDGFIRYQNIENGGSCFFIEIQLP